MVSEGEATFVLPASEWLSAAPPGRVQGGAIALLAEAALSTAIQTTLPARTALSPIDLKVNYLRPLASDGREATARGTVMCPHCSSGTTSAASHRLSPPSSTAIRIQVGRYWEQFVATGDPNGSDLPGWLPSTTGAFSSQKPTTPAVSRAVRNAEYREDHRFGFWSP